MDDDQKSDYKQACERCGGPMDSLGSFSARWLVCSAKILCLSCIEADEELSADNRVLKDYFEGPR